MKFISRHKKSLKKLDIFGYPIKLEFDNKGSTHRTSCGALASIIFALVSVVIVSQCMAAPLNAFQGLGSAFGLIQALYFFINWALTSL